MVAKEPKRASQQREERRAPRRRSTGGTSAERDSRSTRARSKRPPANRTSSGRSSAKRPPANRNRSTAQQGRQPSKRTAAAHRKDASQRRRPANRLLPILALVLSLVAFVLVLQRGVHMTDRALEAAAAAQGSTTVVYEPAEYEDTAAQEYEGVECPWRDTLLFTTGNATLDEQVKTFCDAISKSSDSAEKNAHAVFDVIVQSDFEPRTLSDMPTGADWALGAAHHYFMTAKPKEGIGGKGDYYEFAAVIEFCLKYFGYDDAIAAPVMGIDTGGGVGTALCFVTDKKGDARVCDPYYNTNGWMIEQSKYKGVVVEDIGQELEPFEKRGLSISQRPAQQKTAQESNLTGTGSYTDGSDGTGGTSSGSDSSSGTGADSSSGTGTSSGTGSSAGTSSSTGTTSGTSAYSSY